MTYPASDASPSRHRACWYGRGTPQIPEDPGFHTIEDGLLLYCAHPMWFPVVGYQFDIKCCATCDYFKPQHRAPGPLPA